MTKEQRETLKVGDKIIFTKPNLLQRYDAPEEAWELGFVWRITKTQICVVDGCFPAAFDGVIFNPHRFRKATGRCIGDLDSPPSWRLYPYTEESLKALDTNRTEQMVTRQLHKARGYLQTKGCYQTLTLADANAVVNILWRRSEGEPDGMDT